MTMSKREFDSLQKKMTKKYGEGIVIRGSDNPQVTSVSSGILSLDYALGIGGWPQGSICGVFGPEDIGKSSVLGLAALREFQKAGHYVGIVAVEPRWSESWAAKHGVDTDKLLIARPANGKEAFDHLLEMVEGRLGMVLFDSIGALLNKSEMELDGDVRPGGQSQLIQWGLQRIQQKAFFNNTFVMLLNQVRDNMKYGGMGMTQPGGHGNKHTQDITVQLKRTSGMENTYKHKIDGQDIIIGRRLTAVIERNKFAEGTGYKAEFDFYQKEVEGFPFGVDIIDDYFNTAKRLGLVLQSGAYYELPDGSRHQGGSKAKEYLAQTPEAMKIIRDAVMTIMRDKARKPVAVDENKGDEDGD